MSNLLSLSVKTLQHYESKYFIDFFKSNKVVTSKFILNLIKFFSIILISNAVILMPALFISSFLFVLKYFFIMNLFLLFLLLAYFFIKTGSLEKIDKKLLSTSVYKDDFFKFLRNDLFFNIKCGLSIFFLLSTYLIINYSIIFSFTKAKNQIFFITVLICIAAIFIITVSFNLIYYIRKKELKSVFFHIENYKEVKNVNLLFFVIIFLVSCFLVISISFMFIKNMLIVLLFSIPISLILSVILNTIFDRSGFYNKNNWLLFINRMKNDSMSKINSNNLKQFSLKRILLLLLPLLLFVSCLILFNLLNRFLKLSFNIFLIQSFLLPLLFVYPSIKQRIVSSNSKKRSMIFTIFVFAILFILNFFNPISSNDLYKNNSMIGIIKDFINPLLAFYNGIFNARNFFVNNMPSFLTVLIVPVFFFFYFLNYKILVMRHYFEKKIDKKLISRLNDSNSTLIFGDSVSKYPFLFSLIINFLVISVLIMELQVISNLISVIIDTLQVASIFNFKFLTKQNILMFFSIIATVVVILMIIKLVIQMLSSFLSHFMLFSDEIVYVENKIFSNIILRIPVSKVNYLIIKQNIIEKFLDIGTIYIETSDKSGIIKIKSISSIKEKNIQIMDKIKIGLQKV
jgi:hypothetical protein